jgi:large subunit ribosomal protein L9
MEVILLKKVESLGDLGDKVGVRPGYGRNFLIPKGYAAAATTANLKAFEERRAELERQAAEGLAAAQVRKIQLEVLTVTVVRRAGDEGRLFGSVGSADIADAAREAGVPLERHEVRLPGTTLRSTGHYDVPVRLHPEVSVTLKVEVVAES